MCKQGCRSQTSPNHTYSLNSKFLFLIFSVAQTSFKRFLSACRSWGQEKRSLCVGPVTKSDQCRVAETVGAAKTNRWGKIEKSFLLWKRRWPDGEMFCSNFIYNVILKKKKKKTRGWRCRQKLQQHWNPSIFPFYCVLFMNSESYPDYTVESHKQWDQSRQHQWLL